MKQLASNWKRGEVKLQVDSRDDLWYLQSIIAPGDLVRGRTMRKITTTSSGDRAKDAVRKPVTLTIQVTKLEFSTTSPVLRVSGQVTQGPEDVPHGSHHTFSVEEGVQFTLTKESWLTYQKEKLKEALEASDSSVLITVMDREEATFALLKNYGYEILGTLKGDVQKKGDDQKTKENFYPLLEKQLQEYMTRLKLQSIVLASPAFWKEDFLKIVQDEELKKKIVSATCSDTGESGIKEVLRRQEVKQALRQERAAKETAAVDALLEEVGKSGLATYGLDHVKHAAEAGAIKELLVSDNLIMKMREDETYDKLDSVMQRADKNQGEVHIISSEHEAGKRLDGIGGIGALLRYRLS